ncbi:AAA family ATPase [Bacillus toyonensis]|uniref:AAA family ATPase n=1 Tax=Bacillus toyonensis TaxID=155322 RepID=UPI002AA5C181
MNKENTSKMIVCYPILYGNGMKYTATSIAHYYKQKYPDKKVALVDFDVKVPYLCANFSMEDKIHGIDNLIEKIDGDFLNEELFKENMISLKNKVDLLKGTKLLKNYNLIEKKHVEKMIDLLRAMYDFIVVTVSPDIDNAGTTNSLFHGDEILLIGRNNFNNLEALPTAVRTVTHFKQNHVSVKLLFNMFNEHSNIDFSRCVGENNLSVIGTVFYNESNVDNQNLFKFGATSKLFSNKKQHEYTQIIEAIE